MPALNTSGSNAYAGTAVFVRLRWAFITGWIAGCVALLVWVYGPGPTGDEAAQTAGAVTGGVGAVAVAYAMTTLTASVLAMLACAWDKRQATRGRDRISERTLHLLELAGGWPGSWATGRLLHHKTRKLSYRWRFRAIALLHILTVATAIYLAWRGQGA